MSGGGFGYYHWLGLVVPLVVVISMPFWMLVRSIPRAWLALLAGAVMAVVAYFMFRYVPAMREPAPDAQAVLLGALLTEAMLFHGTTNFPSATSIMLFLFLYLYSVESAGSHW